ncbi:retrotransposon gag family protein [Nostoc sp. GT001]|uniref:retrotransposon gag family protein n=1 Tax=Nostoc sp. GT001 TaxID=3056647 RepID=UPI0025AA979F|nr:retrotransposon gag family protein [Nostoc sp. GT001]MDM9586367.1 retrotransposon gag domain-containing protein [Nostoc sp. GT001]
MRASSPSISQPSTGDPRIDHLLTALEQVNENMKLQNDAISGVARRQDAAEAAAILDRSDDRGKTLDRFHKHLDYKFSGLPNTISVDDWVEKVENVFKVLGVRAEFKVSFATYSFTDYALRWWATEDRTWREKGRDPTWHEFKVIFLDRFVPQDYREARIYEFLALTQGNMTVDQYDAKFNALSKYATYIVSTLRSSSI